MYQIPPASKASFESALDLAAISQQQRPFYRKWLAYFWDFCQKYDRDPAKESSLSEFIDKLATKHQSLERRQQAEHAICLYQSRLNGGKDYQRRTVSPASKPEPAQPVLNPSTDPWQRVMDDLAKVIRTRHYSPKTLKAYSAWIRQFRHFVKEKSPAHLNDKDVKDFLSHLATSQNVAASTQNQAFNALIFLFKFVLKRQLGDLRNTVRAKRKPYIPVVLSRTEIDRIFSELTAPYDLIVKLLYGCGLRIKECVSLRVQNLNLDLGLLTIHDGKGKKDRTVPLPQVLLPELHAHLDTVSRLHLKDLNAGYDGTFLFHALNKKYQNAAKELVWQFLFPAITMTKVPETGELRRYHLHESHVQRAITAAVRKARIPKRASAHTFRHSFATHLLQANFDIVTIQELMGRFSRWRVFEPYG